MAGNIGRPRVVITARCPDPTHRGGNVVGAGKRATQSGTRQTYRCDPLAGDRHYFTVVTAEDEPVLAPVMQRAPSCASHPSSRVVRDGTYGKRSLMPRQRYRCFYELDGATRSHCFTASVAREQVHATGVVCDECDGHVGVHQGAVAVARQHSWPVSMVARGLEQLSSGASYTEVSRWAVRAEAAAGTGELAHPAPAPREVATVGPGTKDEEPNLVPSPKPRLRPRRTSVKEASVSTTKDGKVRRRSRASVEAKNLWHIAADWCEVFGPVVWEPIDAKLRERATVERARLDELKAAGAELARPQVLLIDDLPVYGRDDAGAKRSRRDSGFFLLTAAEVTWQAPDPWDTLGEPIARTELRVVRAFAKSNTPAWRLVFDELGYAPDFVVADAGTGQLAAVGAHYPNTVFVPSVWHLGQAIRTALRDVPAAHVVTAAGKVLHPDLEAHLHQLRRGTDALATPQGHARWWDELLTWARQHRVPVEKLNGRRRDYEPRMAAAIPMLAAHPQVPISTGGLEAIQRRVLAPILAGRRAVFGNIERTNTLLDLAVAREHGAFDNLADVARLLRRDATREGGFAPPLRAVADPIGTRGKYSSLRDVTLLHHLAESRGLT